MLVSRAETFREVTPVFSCCFSISTVINKMCDSGISLSSSLRDVSDDSYVEKNYEVSNRDNNGGF